MPTAAKRVGNMAVVILVLLSCTLLTLMAAGLFFIVLGWPAAVLAAVVGILGTGTLAATIRSS